MFKSKTHLENTMKHKQKKKDKSFIETPKSKDLPCYKDKGENKKLRDFYV